MSFKLFQSAVLALAAAAFACPSTTALADGENRSSVTFPAGTFGVSNGVRVKYSTPGRDGFEGRGSRYRVEFSFRFRDGFAWDRGGKFGYGMLVGEGITGGRGDAARAGRGGSFRVMWGSDSRGAYIYPYVYFKDMTGRYGESFGVKHYISDNRYYRLRLDFRENSKNHLRDGLAKLSIGTSSNMRQIFAKNLRWANDWNNRKVQSLIFINFRGGADSSWAAPRSSTIDFTDVNFTRLAR